MEYLTDHLKSRIMGEIIRAPSVHLFLDFDGTLCPIMPKPEMARLSAETLKTLGALAKVPKFSLGIVTGRSLKQIMPLIGVKGISYVGNHGLELCGPGFNHVHAKTKRFNPILRETAMALLPLEKSFPGSFLENKGVSITYHFRLMDERLTSYLIIEIQKRLAHWIDANQIKIVPGKMAYEVWPGINWNKGSAVRWILLHENPESLPVYIGDDRTDEAAFKALRDRGITIRVGDGEDSSARYYVNDSSEVEKLLSLIAGSGGTPTKFGDKLQ